MKKEKKSQQSRLSNLDEITLIPNKNMHAVMKETHLIKIRHPDSEHNKKLIRDNNYGHGRIISESAVTVRNLK
jgi:hypothetical protein